MKTAIIDMGTNTFHLLIADASKKIIHEEKMPVKMGMGGINNGIITEEGIERTMQSLTSFSTKCVELSVKKIQAFGTSALRNARNSSTIIERAKRELGIDIIIISGDEEANLIYHGVREAVRMGIEKSLVVDIGGGSVEFIVADEKEILWKQSIEIGGQRLYEQFHKHDPILPEEIIALRNYLEEALSPVAIALKNFKPTMLIGSSGTFETLSDIFCVRQNIINNRNPESPLTIEQFHKINSDLKQMNKQERIKMPGMMEWRAEMIVVTCTLIEMILELHDFETLKVSRYSLKEGALALL
jgi:exopolyphosphatase / guanosine-5'-triphosphate,3'-diphosphate pyrophosphatase